MLPVKSLYCVFCSLFVFLHVHSQVYTNDAGTREKHFIYEVKQIDEFFERFNNDTGSFIRKAYKNYKVKYNIDRTKLVKSLFNYETKSWDMALIDSFVKDINASPVSGKLNFQAEGWYAEANCKFQYNGTVTDVPIILRISTDSRKRSKWVIAAVKSGVFKNDSTAVHSEMDNNTKPRFINPASHANSFIELDKALNDKENLAEYFEPSFFGRNHSGGFYNAVFNNQAKFLYVKDITYHFLQASRWIFTVEYFQRESLNAGWLINSLKRASETDKATYLKHLLEEQ